MAKKFIYHEIHKILKIIIHILKLLQKIYEVLFQNLMSMEHFQICILKLIKNFIYWKLMDQFN